MKAHRHLLLAAETEGPGGEGCDARRGGTKALSRRRHRHRHSRVLRLPCAERRGPREELSAARRAARRLHVRAAEGVQGRRARRGQGRQGRQRHDHGDDRRQDDRRADEGRRRVRVRTALAPFAPRRHDSRRAPTHDRPIAPIQMPSARIAALNVYPDQELRAASAWPQVRVGRTRLRRRDRRGQRRRSRMDDRRSRRALRHAARVSRGSRRSQRASPTARWFSPQPAGRRSPCRSRAMPAPTREVVVWNSVVPAHDAGDDAAAWLSSVLGADVRLVRFDPAHRRLCNPDLRRRLGRAHGVRRWLSAARHRRSVARRPQRAPRGQRGTRRCR